jgi:hypothetical protein
MRSRIAAIACAVLLAGHAWAQPPGAPAPSFGNLPLQRDDARAGGILGWGEALGAVVLLVVLVAGLQYARRRGGRAAAGSWWSPKPAADGLRSGQAIRLTPAASLHVVQWGGEELLVACTSGAVTLLGRRPLAAAGDAEAHQ